MSGHDHPRADIITDEAVLYNSLQRTFNAHGLPANTIREHLLIIFEAHANKEGYGHLCSGSVSVNFKHVINTYLAICKLPADGGR